MITELGKLLRKLRIDEDERLLDMAGRLGKSSSFVSAVEVGKKAPPAGFEERVIKTYRLVADVAEELRSAADRSRKDFVLSPDSDLGRNTAGLLARKMNTLSEEDFKEIQAILTRSKG